ncbi:hypothetical protein ILUMI_09902, partial [Ignelater luminosus]
YNSALDSIGDNVLKKNFVMGYPCAPITSDKIETVPSACLHRRALRKERLRLHHCNGLNGRQQNVTIQHQDECGYIIKHVSDPGLIPCGEVSSDQFSFYINDLSTAERD